MGEPADVYATTFSNSIRLNGRDWLYVGVFAALLLLAPVLWKQGEPLAAEPDYRMPHELGYDYWLYERWATLAAGQYDTLLLGDSVIWGEYVSRQGTLSHYLNECAGQQRFANLGLDGVHPLALAGLIEHYAGSVANKRVLLHFNPLWLSSPRRDLQDSGATDFNHPRLLPQFVSRIPAYKEEISPRIGVVVEQHLPLSSWTAHLQQAYYGGHDLPRWTLTHPYANPAEPLMRGLPTTDPFQTPPVQPRRKRHIERQDFPWVELDTSLQWQAFGRAIKMLRDRGNRVFVLVGPFNEHMLQRRCRVRYQALKARIGAWLLAEQVPHALPAPLVSAQYGDASHPLAAGYAELARQLWAEPAFRAVLALDRQ